MMTLKRNIEENQDYLEEGLNLRSVSGVVLVGKIQTTNKQLKSIKLVNQDGTMDPTKLQKKKYKQFLLNFQYTLPCKYCRINLKNNFKTFPLKDEHFENRDKFSRYIYNLHEIINKMLGKKSKIKYCDLRDKYEHFRSRCTIQNKDDLKNHNKIFKYNSSKFKNTMKQMTENKSTKESGCTIPLYGKKSKCVINIVPQEKKCKTFKIDKKCLKQKLSFK